MRLSVSDFTNVRLWACCLAAVVTFGSASLAIGQQTTPAVPAQDLPQPPPPKPSGGLNIEQLMESQRQRLPQVGEGGFQLPMLAAPSTATDDIGNGRTPEGFRGGDKSPLQVLPEDGTGRVENWQWSYSNWVAANTYSRPRYFEDRMLERHGHQRFPRLQPLASGVRFFGSAAMLPYLMAVRDPFDCEYTMGYYRPGSAAPCLLQRPPYDRRGVIAESAVVSGAILAFP